MLAAAAAGSVGPGSPYSGVWVYVEHGEDWMTEETPSLPESGEGDLSTPRIDFPWTLQVLSVGRAVGRRHRAGGLDKLNATPDDHYDHETPSRLDGVGGPVEDGAAECCVHQEPGSTEDGSGVDEPNNGQGNTDSGEDQGKLVFG